MLDNGRSRGYGSAAAAAAAAAGSMPIVCREREEIYDREEEEE